VNPYDELLRRDPGLEPVLTATGRPDPFEWHDGERTRGDPFAGLVLHISSQQISTVVAFRLYDRLAAETGGLPDPAGVAALSGERWRELGFSHAKVKYLGALARQILDGELDLAALAGLPDDEVRARLTALPGVGNWTTDLFMIFQLHRPDIFPAGDLALRHAVGRWLPPTGTSIREVEERAARWAPFRTYAAGAFWHSLKISRTA
jgi:3-methyladenine DNA glycosylase/8-oxoguanine DNA glycosylase